ncbi:MAG: periplasmic heavy metal sensor [Rubrivivax sp.]
MSTFNRTSDRSLAGVLAVGLVAAAAALAQMPAQAQPMGGPGHGPGPGMMAGGGPGMMMGGGPGMMRGGPGMMGGMLHERALDAVNATAEQRTQIRQIMDAARTELKAQHDASRALRDQAVQLFTQPTVDARAAEGLRQQMSAQHELASKRMLQAMLEVSRVLTPEQRAKLAELHAQRRSMMEQRRGAGR